MYGHIGIAVTEQAAGMGDFDTAEYQIASFGQPVDIIAFANTEHLSSSPCKMVNT